MNLRSGGDRAKRGHLTCFLIKKTQPPMEKWLSNIFRKEAVSWTTKIESSEHRSLNNFIKTYFRFNHLVIDFDNFIFIKREVMDSFQID